MGIWGPTTMGDGGSLGEGTLRTNRIYLEAQRLPSVKAQALPIGHGLSRAACAEIASALYKAELGHGLIGERRTPERIELLALVDELLLILDRELGCQFTVSDGDNADGSVRHCRNGQFLRAMLESCRCKTRLPIPAKLKPLVKSARAMQFIREY